MSGKEKSHRRRAHHGGGHGGGGHHGGAWKVAYADFTTAMMAFFLLMWILAASSPKQKSAIAQYFRSEGPFKNGGGTMSGTFKGGQGLLSAPISNSVMNETQSLEMVARELGEAMSSGAEAGAEGGAEAGTSDLKDQMSVTLGDDGLIIEITDDKQDELFSVGGDAMNPKFQKVLDAVASKLNGLPNKVRVEGYTDARPYPQGVDYSNWELSSDRANAARRYLEKRGLTRDRFESVVGYGDGRLAAPASPMAPANRRITITVLRDNPIKPVADSLGGGAPDEGFQPFGQMVDPHSVESAPIESAPRTPAGHDRNER
jgi:chemotaxis protein MotB